MYLSFLKCLFFDVHALADATGLPEKGGVGCCGVSWLILIDLVSLCLTTAFLPETLQQYCNLSINQSLSTRWESLGRQKEVQRKIKIFM